MKSDENEMKLTDEEAESLLYFLKRVPDPRDARGVRYRYYDLLLMCVYSVLAGYSEATDIEYFVEIHKDYFKERLGIETVPSHDTFSRVMRLTDFNALSESLDEWLHGAFPQIYELYGGMKVMHIDGKAVRGASEKSHGEKPIYQLNAMVEGESIGVKTEKVGEKTNELGCLPDFINQLNLNNTIVTIDAMGCNQKVIDAIHKKGGKFVLPVKENQPNLSACILKRTAELEKEGKFKTLDRAETMSNEHGRYERNTLSMIDDTSFIYESLGISSFYGSVARVGILDKKVVKQDNGKEVTERTRNLLITDLENITADDMLKIKKSHWNIEMQHWQLDIQLREDAQTARKDNSVPNGAILRRFCLMVKKYDKVLSEKPLKRFLMSNANDIMRIENILFNNSFSNNA
ncbi:MAG: ISAs1 family transposase [Prevotella sp.]|nr:ISAs1 family transposase [Prevotella sp.]